TSCCYCGRVSPPFITGFPDGFFFNFDSTCKIQVLKREVGEEKALLAAGYMKTSTVIPLDETLAIAAADIALQEKLAMADAIIVAVSRIHNCRIISSDADLQDQANVIFIPKK
ncbi:MAG: type II toxin-antitoxin system VapC family toxin, partial [Desulfobacteraceae bacterium]